MCAFWFSFVREGSIFANPTRRRVDSLRGFGCSLVCRRYCRGQGGFPSKTLSLSLVSRFLRGILVLQQYLPPSASCHLTPSSFACCFVLSVLGFIVVRSIDPWMDPSSLLSTGRRDWAGLLLLLCCIVYPRNEAACTPGVEARPKTPPVFLNHASQGRLATGSACRETISPRQRPDGKNKRRWPDGKGSAA